MKNAGIFRWVVILAAVLIGSACILQTAAPTTQLLVVTATPDGAVADPSLQTPDSGTAPTWTLTLSPELTHTATIAQVTLTAGQRLSCVKGPHWILYEWVAAIEEGETVVLTARSTADWPDYYYARKSDGKECWAFGASSAITGDPSTLPVREAPPLPTVTMVIQNNTHMNIVDIFIRGKDETSWGADRLSGSVLPGTTHSLTLTAGFYDVQIKDPYAAIWTKEDAAIGPDPSSRVLSIDTQIHFSVYNHSGVNLCRLRAYPVDGTPLIEIPIPGDGVLADGETIYADLLVGKYEFRYYRCGDLALAGSSPEYYIGPVVGGITLY